MNIFAISLCVLAFGTVFVGTTQATAETKKVCLTDQKTKKEVCKTVRVHKKVEGTPVPDKSARK